MTLHINHHAISAGRRNTWDETRQAWRVVLGESRNSFFSVTGPPEVCYANLALTKIRVNTALVITHYMVDSSSTAGPAGDGIYNRSSNSDTYTLTIKGVKELES